MSIALFYCSFSLVHVHFSMMCRVIYNVIFFTGFTALHKAVFVNSIQVVNYLVSIGANVNMQVIILPSKSTVLIYHIY